MHRIGGVGDAFNPCADGTDVDHGGDDDERKPDERRDQPTDCYTLVGSAPFLTRGIPTRPKMIPSTARG
jgi:hypothetical protein